jgi:predicted nucleic acid-binding protein
MLGHSTSAARWFDSTTGRDDDRVVSSRILRTEITHVLRRENLPVTDRDQILDYVDTIPLDHAVLQEVEAVIPHIRTLDAIHLASALRSGLEDLVIVTHDTTRHDTTRHDNEIIGCDDRISGSPIRWNNALAQP